MAVINLMEQSGTQMLGTRPTARAMVPAIRDALESGCITMDTSGIRRISVSFFDESLLILNELMIELGNNDLRLVYHKGPQPESLKNLAANRGLTVSESSSGDWIITRKQ